MAAVNVFENSIAFSLSIGRLGVRRKVDSSSVKVKEENLNGGEQPDATAIAVSKEIIDCPEYDSIRTMDGMILRDISRYALPAPFKRGIYLIPIKLVQTCDELIKKYVDDRETAVEKFCAVYGETVTAQKIRLGALYNPDDYPPVSDVRETFTVKASYLDLGTPQRLQSINPQIFERERRQFEAKLQSAADEVRTALRVTFQDLVTHMAERLTPAADGKPKKFHDSLIKNLGDFLKTFSDRNISEDADLSALVEQAKNVLQGRTADELRRPIVRDTVNADITKIKEEIDKLVVVGPSRKFDFTSDE